MGLITQTGQAYYQGSNIGDYQFISLEDIINNFIVAYVGEDKIISKIKRTDVQFHAMRGLQELSFDTFKSVKSQEIVLPPSLTMQLPQDYVNYVKFSFIDKSGFKHVIYPTRHTFNPTDVTQDADGNYTFDGSENLITDNSSTAWEAFKTLTPHENRQDDYDYDDEIFDHNVGQRYGQEPEHANVNGNFYIDPNTGLVHFSSLFNGKTIALEYISDGLGTDAEMKVHKFAEEAMYKHIAHAILATRANTQEFIIARFKKERFAAIRTAKLRLSNIKLEEITQIMRGKSKHIKH
jgi:hypothetical protein